jgi:hypothetical protein
MWDPAVRLFSRLALVVSSVRAAVSANQRPVAKPPALPHSGEQHAVSRFAENNTKNMLAEAEIHHL